MSSPQPSPAATAIAQPQATPAVETADGHPPCPSDGAPPPGHNKGAEPQERPCDGGKADQDKDNKSDHDKDYKKDKHDPSGGLLLLPLTAVGSLLGAARPTGPLQRAGSSLRMRRRGR